MHTCEYQKCPCSAEAVPGERFCAKHRAAFINDMHESGYLRPLSRRAFLGKPRGYPAGNFWDNVVQAYEDGPHEYEVGDRVEKAA